MRTHQTVWIVSFCARKIVGENRDFFYFHRRSPALEQFRSPVDGLGEFEAIHSSKLGENVWKC